MIDKLERIIKKPRWKEVLINLIITEKIDPRDVDLVKLSEAFIRWIREMKELDLYVPSNVILASAILLRYKSYYIQFSEIQEEGDYPKEEEVRIPREEPPPLPSFGRIPPKRKVTLDEIIREIDRIIKYEEKREKSALRRIDEVVNLKIDALDIEKKMEEIMKLIKTIAENGLATFSSLVRGKEKKEVVRSFLTILHLENDGKINLDQKETFGEITIRIKEK